MIRLSIQDVKLIKGGEREGNKLFKPPCWMNYSNQTLTNCELRHTLRVIYNIFC